MKPHPRIRKTIKWGGAVVTVLLVVVWVGSGWWALNRDFFPPGGGYLSIRAGAVRWSHVSPSIDDRTFAWVMYRTGSPTFDWRFVCERSNWGWHLELPLWLPLGGTFLATMKAWHLDTLARRRAKGGLNLCPKCGYDRTGILQDAKCPECGAVPDARV